jgi:hypothetical protein
MARYRVVRSGYRPPYVFYVEKKTWWGWRDISLDLEGPFASQESAIRHLDDSYENHDVVIAEVTR